MNQRGSIIIYTVLALAILATLSGIAYKIRESGKDAIRLEWAEANKTERERLDREREVRNTITDKREAEHATNQANSAADFRAELLRLRKQQVHGEAQPLSAAAAVITCPGRQADVAERLASLEEGILGLLERGNKAIIRTVACKSWLDDQIKVNVK